MSTQLILYPQDYQGYSYNTQVNTGNFASNSFFTSNLTNQGSTYGIGQVYNYGIDVIALSAYSSGGWTGFYSDTTGAYWNPPQSPFQPSTSGGNFLRLYAKKTTAPYGSICGVAQSITGLTIGASYDLKFSHTSHAGKISWRIGSSGQNTQNFIGNNGTIANTTIGGNDTDHTLNFTATATTMPLIIAANGTSTLIYTDVSNIEVIGAVSETLTVAEGDGQVICDLYEEEDIPLTLNVDNFKNVVEKPQSYSKSFDLPNTKRNAKIFTHIFDITKTIETVYDFNPYAQTRAVLKQDGVLIFEGTLRLIDIKDKEGEISYNVNLFTSSIALKEVLESRTFADLTDVFTELQHQYQFTQIDNSWNGILDLTNPLPTDTFAGTAGASTTAVLKYPFVDWGGMINCTGSKPDVNVLEQAFRPCISVLYIIRNIFRQAGFEYTSSFFDTDANFANLYMDFNWGSNNAPNDWTAVAYITYEGSGDVWTGTSSTTAQFPGGPTSGAGAATGWDPTTSLFTATQDNTEYTITSDCNFFNVTGNTVFEVWWENSVTGIVAGTYQTYTFSSYGSFNYNIAFIDTIVNDTETLSLKTKADVADRVKQFGIGWNWAYNFTSNIMVANNDNMVRGTLVNTLRGELGQWDFLKGIMTMFNLISMPDPDDPTKILIEPYPDVFGQAAKITKTTRDWTYKLDTKDIKLEPLELKKQIVFKYSEDDDDFAFNLYKQVTNGYLYGSLSVDGPSLLGSQVSILTGEDEVEAAAFAATICKPIQSVFPNFRIPVIYSATDDGIFEGFDNMPRILLWNGIATNNWECPAQNGVAGGTKTEYGQMTHVSSVPSLSTDYDLNFGACSSFLGSAPTNNLYNLYYSEYFDELYNNNTRILTAKINLSATDINTFLFYDIIILKNRKFRVNKINYKPNSLSTVEFILIP